MTTAALPPLPAYVAAVQQLAVYRGQKHPGLAGAGMPAPHKPLLLLLAIGSVKQPPRMRPFSSWETPLSQLLETYAYGKAPHHPEFPFVRLSRDHGGGLWELQNEPSIQQGHDASPSALLQAGTSGGLTETFHSVVQQRENGGAIVRAILRTYWASPEERYLVARDTGTDDVLYA